MCATANELRLALLQQDIAWEDPRANYERVEEAFRHVRADLLVVPEMFTIGFGGDMARLAEPPEGPTLRFAARMARQHNALFVATWPVAEGGKAWNRMHWVAPDGSHGSYDKAHTFRMSNEAEQLARGTRRATFLWRGWRIRPAVCYDLRFPVWLRNRALAPTAQGQPPEMDYDLLLLCANWPASRRQAWDTLLRARAIENQCYVAGANRVGADGTETAYSGNSAVINYKGCAVAEAAPDAQQVVTATLNKEKLQGFRTRWPFWLDAD